MFSGFSKLIDRSFIVGFLFPSAIALILLARIFPEVSELKPLASPLADDDKIGKLTYVTFLFYGLAIILSLFNGFFYKLVEGYLWPISNFGILRIRELKRYRGLKNELVQQTNIWKKLPDGSSPPQKYIKTQRQLLSDFPSAEEDLLPTSFGNAIAAFESYPNGVYGADAVPIWLRLGSVIPKDFTAELEAIRSQVDFFLNMLILLPLIGVAAILHGLFTTRWGEVLFSLRSWAFLAVRPTEDTWIAGCTVILWPFIYRSAVVRAQAWGQVVMAAFDAFLPKLITQLGYQAPASEAARAALWTDINKMIVFREPIPSGRWKLAGEPTPESHVTAPEIAGDDAGSDNATAG